jgi:hypothetical protein
MPYIGSDPSNRFVAPKAASVFSGDGSTTAFTLDHAVGSDEDILVSVDGVIQEPSVAYAVSSGTTLTFTAAPSSNSGNNIFVYYLFRTVGTVSHPSNNALSATTGTFTGALSAKGGAVFNEDSADVDFRVESNGEANMLVVDGGNNAVVIGESAPDTSISGGTPAFQVIGSAFDSFMSLTRRVASASAPVLALTKSRNTSVGSHTIVQDGDTIGEINFFADDGTDFDSRVGTIKAQVDGTPGANDTPGRLVFMTSADGSNSPSERMRIDSSGNVGIGGNGNPTLYVVNNNAGPGLTAANATAVFHGSVDAGKGGCIGFDFGASHTNYPVGIGYVITSQSGSTKGDLCFYTRSGTGDDAPSERIRITSDGRVGINDSTPTAGVDIAFDTQQVHALQIRNSNSSTGGGKYIQFAKANGDFTGSITQSSDQNTVAFNTSSDYRLKENVSYDFDATSRLKQLKPARFNWISDENNTTIDGFIAHEVSGIVPEAITGEKDGTQDVGTIKDEDDNVLHTDVLEITKQDGETWTKTGTKNVYQGIDQSKLVPLLVKTIQELEARITALENA